MTGEHIKRAFASRDPLSKMPRIIIDFDETGKTTFADVTVRNIGYQLAIVLDGKLVSAPRILQEISGGSATVSGAFTAAEAMDLANALQTPLPFSVKVQFEKTY